MSHGATQRRAMDNATWGVARHSTLRWPTHLAEWLKTPCFATVSAAPQSVRKKTKPENLRHYEKRELQQERGFQHNQALLPYKKQKNARIARIIPPLISRQV